MNIVMFFFHTNLHITKGWNSTYSQLIHLFLRKPHSLKKKRRLYTEHMHSDSLTLRYADTQKWQVHCGCIHNQKKEQCFTDSGLTLCVYYCGVANAVRRVSSSRFDNRKKGLCAKSPPCAQIRSHGNRLHHLTVLLKSLRNVHTKLKLPDHWNSKAQLWQIGGYWF